MKRTTIFSILLGIALGCAVFLNIHYTQTNNVSIVGKFYGNIEGTDTNGNTDIYYQFKSNDDEVWWLFTAKEIGFVPNTNTEYTLTYNTNGTTRVNNPCDCTPELECECEVYDDEFVGIREMRK